MGSFIQLSAADGTQVPAYVAQPDTPAKAAVVVIQEIFGVNTHIREVADAYASEGYLAIAPAMFHRVQANVELGYAEADMGLGWALKQPLKLCLRQALCKIFKRPLTMRTQCVAAWLALWGIAGAACSLGALRAC